MHFVADFLVYIVINLMWEGVCYLTGSALVRVFSGGRFVAGSWREASDDGSSSHTGTIAPGRTSPRRIDAVSVSFIGTFFWIAIAFLLWATFNGIRT